MSYCRYLFNHSPINLRALFFGFYQKWLCWSVILSESRLRQLQGTLDLLGVIIIITFDVSKISKKQRYDEKMLDLF